MLKILSIEDTRNVEAESDKLGHTYDMMMQSAGQAIAHRVLALIGDRPEPKVTVIVGSGNNGGDSLVAGQIIAEENDSIQVRFYLLKERDDKLFKSIKDAGLFFALADDDNDKRVLRNMVASSDILIDGLFGIGIRLPIEGEPQKILRNINQALGERHRARQRQMLNNPCETEQILRPLSTIVVAVDCPSGLDCDTGEIDNNSIRADETITFIAAKSGLLEFPGAAYVGALQIAHIDIPDGIKTLESAQDVLLDNEVVRGFLPARPLQGHKGTYGKALIVAGSINYSGAAGLAAEGAYRSGTGLVTVASAPPVTNALASHFLEMTWLLLPHDLGVISSQAASIIRERMSNYSAMLIGCGLDQEETTRDMMIELLGGESNPKKRSIGFGDTEVNRKQGDNNPNLPPLVIDADGLNHLAEIEQWWTLLPENTIITPHPGEMANLCDITTDELKAANRRQFVVEKAKAWNIIIVLKGAHTIIAGPKGNTYTSPFKIDALSTAGTGDILAGLITGFVAQGIPAIEAAALGVYVHAKAGLIAKQQFKSGHGVIASDITKSIALAIGEIEQG